MPTLTSTYISHGLYSEVFALGGNGDDSTPFAIKRGRSKCIDDGRGVAKYDGWLEYARWIIKHRDDIPADLQKHFPRIYALHAVPGERMVAVVEKYASTLTYFGPNVKVGGWTAGQRKAFDIHEFAIGTAMSYTMYRGDWREQYDHYVGDDGKLLKTIPQLETMLEALEYLKAQGVSSGTDLHGGNVMIAYDGTFIINDPFSG